MPAAAVILAPQVDDIFIGSKRSVVVEVSLSEKPSAQLKKSEKYCCNRSRGMLGEFCGESLKANIHGGTPEAEAPNNNDLDDQGRSLG